MPSFEDDTRTSALIAWWGNKTDPSPGYPPGFELRVSCTKDGLGGLEIGFDHDANIVPETQMGENVMTQLGS